MDTIWFILLFSIIALGSIAIGVTRNRRFRDLEHTHQQLAKQLGLEIAFADPKDYAIFGLHRGYSLRVEPVNLAFPGAKVPAWHTKIHIPMVNPLRKMIRISRKDPSHSALEALVQVGRADAVAHDLASWMHIQSNDLLFSGIILSENVKISIHKAFKGIPAGVCYIEDEELAFVFSGFLNDQEQVKRATYAVELLCDIKDELNVG